MQNPTITPESKKIDKIIREIADGEIKIPEFQRGYVWKQDQIIQLLESIVLQFPIGSLLFWEVNGQEKLKAARNVAGYNLPNKSDTYPIKYVLDGQQRASTIFAVFADGLTQDKDTKQYNPNLDIFEVYYNFQSKKFLNKADAPSNDANVLALRNLLNITRLIESLKNLDPQHHEAAQNLMSTFLNYEIPVVTIKNRSRSEVGKIFERINNTGTKLGLVDLMTAWTWTEDFHLLDEANKIQEELSEKGFGSINYKLILQITSAIISKSTTTETILGIEADKIRDNWDKICEALRKCVDFLSTKIGCHHIDFLPFNQQLAPLCYYFSNSKSSNNTQLNQLTKWFWLTSFSDRYSTGQTTDKMDADITLMDDISKNIFSGVDKYSYTATTNELMQA